MTFTVTYREKDGAKAETVVEATNRAECVAACKARGIVPTMIREGGCHKSTVLPNNRDKRNRSRRMLWGTAILAGVALVLGGAWVWLADHPASGPYQPEQPAKHKSEKHATLPKPVLHPKPAPNPGATNAAPVAKEESLPPWDDSFMKNREMRLKYSTLFQATTNEGGLVIERYRLPNGKTWRKIIEPPPLFGNICDQAIAMVMSGAAGAPIPPVPGLDNANLDAEFLKSLEVPIRIEPDDPPRVAALKLAVKETRDEIVRLKADGDKRTVGQMLNEHIKATNRNAEMQAEALRAIEEVRRKDGDEMADEYLKAVNENLKSYGVAPVSIGRRRTPPHEK